MVHATICIFIGAPSIHPSIHPSVHPSIHSSIHPSFILTDLSGGRCISSYKQGFNVVYLCMAELMGHTPKFGKRKWYVYVCVEGGIRPLRSASYILYQSQTNIHSGHNCVRPQRCKICRVYVHKYNSTQSTLLQWWCTLLMYTKVLWKYSLKCTL